MRRFNKAGWLISSTFILAGCGNSAEVKQKLETVYQCINAPASIQQSFDLAINEKRLPVYVTSENKGQYSSAEWYVSNQEFYDGIYWDLEDWSSIEDVSECDNALKTIEADYPKDESVRTARSFIGFTDSLFNKYHKEQVEGAAFGLLFTLQDVQKCLIVDNYPQAFILNDYQLERGFYAGGFSIDWDGDDFSVGTSTADGRGPLWRPIKSVKDTGCLKDFEVLSPSYIDWALTVDDSDIISWSEYSDYKKLFEDITEAVDTYNEIVTDQHGELKAVGETIPPKGPYMPPIIHQVGIEYFSDYDFEQTLTTCQKAKPETFVNGRGETLTSPSQECRMVQSLCNTDGIEPPLDKKTCAPYVYK